MASRSPFFQDERHFDLHPFGKVPVLLHGARRLYETAAICRYLDAAFDGPALQPGDLWERARVDQWCAVLALYVDQALVRCYLLEFAFPKGADGSVRMDRVKEAQPEVSRMLRLLDTQLGKREYLVGEQFTIADAIAAPMLDYLFKLPSAASLFADVPRLAAYVQRLHERESCRKVLIDAKAA
ncbi:hypothetical protein GCM10007160_41400 [Litchfieldella qijiaojingensis]|uniref:glutathione transferase n=1 Tax=Litchfieldella qijiaojingensis TaxID=980347 RepID=A0ABQ2ZA06_9GAMM|nr:glutathione S-transferase family protein [Halomonas qijiaojingensis]GGY09850.1 hypothetical protein GCM10007160_41400 [Halomonas qijiaojingensis]